mmetsp:Transcript_14274/g.42562  ORF Transcript_14274/g.42562 Transcript_14274/m.42562 type:complete len:266 (+) Transcript_14274:153-950(+)
MLPWPARQHSTLTSAAAESCGRGSLRHIEERHAVLLAVHHQLHLNNVLVQLEGHGRGLLNQGTLRLLQAQLPNVDTSEAGGDISSVGQARRGEVLEELQRGCPGEPQGGAAGGRVGEVRQDAAEDALVLLLLVPDHHLADVLRRLADGVRVMSPGGPVGSLQRPLHQALGVARRGRDRGPDGREELRQRRLVDVEEGARGDAVLNRGSGEPGHGRGDEEAAHRAARHRAFAALRESSTARLPKGCHRAHSPRVRDGAEESGRASA